MNVFELDLPQGDFKYVVVVMGITFTNVYMFFKNRLKFIPSVKTLKFELYQKFFP